MEANIYLLLVPGFFQSPETLSLAKKMKLNDVSQSIT